MTASSGTLKAALQAETITAGAATQVVILPPTAQPIIAGVATPISIKLEDQFGNIAAAGTSSNVVTITRTPHGPTYTVTTGVTSGQELSLFSTSTTAQFFSTATSTTPITSIVIPKGSTAGATVYYKDLTPGVSTVFVDGANVGSTFENETITEGASQVVFTNAPQTFTAGALSTTNALTVELKAADGTVAFATSPVTINLTTTSGTGTFHDAAGDPATITSVTIGTGLSTATFTYSDTTAGTPTITATSVPLTSASQTETVKAAAATHFTFTTSSTSFPEITPSPTITITMRDQFGNAADSRRRRPGSQSDQQLRNPWDLPESVRRSGQRHIGYDPQRKQQCLVHVFRCDAWKLHTEGNHNHRADLFEHAECDRDSGRPGRDHAFSTGNFDRSRREINCDYRDSPRFQWRCRECDHEPNGHTEQHVGDRSILSMPRTP